MIKLCFVFKNCFQGQGSSYFTQEEENEILEETNMTVRYLQEIQKRYSQLDPSKSTDEISGVTVEQVLDIPEVRTHKLAVFLAEKYGGRNRTLYPRDLVDFFGALNSQRNPLEKVDILFNVLDVKKMDYLGPIEMYRYYHLMLSPSLNNKQIEEMTNNAVKQAGGKIDKDKFRSLMSAWQIAEKMTIDLQLTD